MIDRHKLRGWFFARRHGLGCRHLVLYGAPILTQAPGSRIALGDRVVLASTSKFTALGVPHPVILRTLASGARLKIGNDVGCSGNVICAALSVDIGDGCLIGSGAIIADTDFHPVDHLQRRYQPVTSAAAAPVKIGRNVFIGANSLILKGSSIGDDSVIGAGSVVSGEIPPGVVAAGNPCRVIRPLRT